MADNTTPDLVITTLEELKAFRDEVNNGNTYKGKTVVLAADIDLKNEEWTPIGGAPTKYYDDKGNVQYKSFQGTFDGQGHTISNLKVTRDDSYVGFFGYTTNGEVKNLTIENATVSGRLGVGVVAGSPYTSKYTNITVTGHVEVEGMAYVGGVGGRNAYADWTNVTVDVDETSYVKADSVEDGTAYRTYVGGVIGFMGEGGHTLSDISSNINVEGSTCDVGGIVGIAHYGNNFENVSCTAEKIELTAGTESCDGREIGAIAGVWNNGGDPVTMTNCSSTADLYTTFVDDNGVLHKFTTSDSPEAAAAGFSNDAAAAEAAGVYLGTSGAAYSSSGSGKLYQQTTDAEGNIVSVTITDKSNVAHEVDKSKFVVDSDFSANYDFPASSGLMFGVNAFASLKDAADNAVDGTTIELRGDTISAAANFDGGGTVTLTGEASLEWRDGWFFVGRGTNAQDTTMIIKDANIGSAAEDTNTTAGSTGFHISNAQNGASDKADGVLNIENSTVVSDYIINKNVLNVIGDGDYNDGETDLKVLHAFGVAARGAAESVSGEDNTAVMNITNGAYVNVVHSESVGIGAWNDDDAYGVVNIENSKLKADDTLTVNAKGKINITNGELIVNKLTNNGNVSVKGESKLLIDSLSGEIKLLNGAIIKDSTVGGGVFVAGNVTFRGDNTFNMITDFGKLTDYYGTEAPMKWTVEAGASVTLTEKARYGLGYGDDVTINGNLTDAKNCRAELTDDDLSFFTHGLVAQEGNGWNQDSKFTVKNAYVEIGQNNSFGNKPGEYGGNYTFDFENAVVTSSRITFYEALSKTTFNVKNSDILLGTFMTRDKDSVFTLNNTNLTSTATSNGSDEGNYNTGTLNVINGSKLTYYCTIKNEAGGIINIDDAMFDAPEIVNDGTITVDADSTVKANTLTNNGSIIIDASGFTGGIKKVIDLNGTAQLAGVTFTNVADGVNTVLGADGDVTLVKADQSTVYVNTAYSSQTAVDALLGGETNGMIYGGNAFSSIADAVKNTSNKNPLNIAFTGSETVASTGIVYITADSIADRVGNIDGRTTTISGINNSAERLWVDLNYTAANDTVAASTLNINDAKLNVTKLKANWNSVINVNDSELDAENIISSNIYSKNNGLINISNSKLTGFNQTSVLAGATTSLYNSELESGSYNRIEAGSFNVLQDSRYTFSELSIAKDGTLNVTDSVAASKEMLSAADIGNTQHFDDNPSTDVIVKVGYDWKNAESAGTLNLKNAEFTLAKAQYNENGELKTTGDAQFIVGAQGTVNMEDSKFSADIVNNAGDFNVSGVSQLNIGTLTGTVDVIGGTVKDSNVGGNVLFTGDATVDGENKVGIAKVNNDATMTVAEGAVLNADYVLAGNDNYFLAIANNGNGGTVIIDGAVNVSCNLNADNGGKVIISETGKVKSTNTVAVENGEMTGAAGEMIINGQVETVFFHVFNGGSATVGETGKLTLDVHETAQDRLTVQANSSLTVNGEVNVLSDRVNIHSTGKLNVVGGVFNATAITNSGTVNISGASDISAKISGDGMVYLRDAALDADTEISGSGRLRFVKGENTITDSTINAEYFQVGARREDSNLSGESVKLTVKDATITSSGSGSDSGWVGSGYAIAAVDGVTYTMALENTAAAFSYLHISDDGNFSVTGSVSDDRKLYRESEYRTFYAGDFIVNGNATFKNTDVRLQKLSINCDNQNNGKIGKLTVDGSYLRLVRSGGTGPFQLWNGGVLSIVNKSYTYARNITFDAGSNGEVLTGSTFNVDELTNNGTITVDYQSLFAFKTISGNGSFTIDMTGYNGGFYKVLDYTGDGDMDYSFVSGYGTNDKLVEIDEDLYVADADQSVLYVNSAYNAEDSGSHLFGYNAFNSFAGALDVVGNGGSIMIENSVADEVSKEIEFSKDIAFTISGTAPAHALPVVTFLNADVTVKDAEILIPELDARQDAIITIDNSTVHDAGGNSIVKSYYNGAIKIVNGSTVHTMQTTTMGYITIDNATLNATWQTNVYGNGLITVTNGANFNTAALHLTGEDYSGRDNTDAERVGKAAEVVVDGARMVVGRVYSDNGADYSYNSGKGMNIGTMDGKNAVLTAKNNAVIEFWGADGETVNIGAGGTVDVAGSTFSVGCRAENGTVILNNAGTINVGGTSQLNVGTLTGNAILFTDGANISESTIGGAIDLTAGIHNWSGKNTVSGMFSAGYNNYGGSMTLNITGDFETQDLRALGYDGETVINIGSADDARTKFTGGQIGIFANSTVNVNNADVTYHYTFIRSAFNVANSTMTISNGTNTYFADNAVVMVENTVWTSGSNTCLGSYDASVAAGNADVTIKNGSQLNAGNLTLTTATGTDYIVKLTVDDATVNASTALNVGAGTTVCITGGTVNAAALNNNGTLTLDHKSTIAFSTLTNSGTITINTTGYTTGEFLLFDYTGNDSKDLAFYESILGDLSKSFIIKDNGDLYYNKANATGTINPNDSSAYRSHEEAIAAGCEELITVDGTFDSKLAHEGLTSTIKNGTFKGTVAGGANIETAKDREFADRSGNTDLTINGGVFEKNVFGSDRVDRGYFERIGVVNTTINDGTFKEYVCGGGMYVYRQLHGELIQTGDINLTINGGEFAKNVYGGNLAFESLYSGNTMIDGNITITINAEKAMKFDQDIIAGSYQSGVVNGDVKVKFTGSGSNLTFDSTSQIWGGCTADHYYTDRRFESAITGDRNFTFDAFIGEFTARIRGFESMDVVNGSVATLTGADLSDINVWTMESGSSLAGSFGNDFKGDTLNILLDEEWSGSDWTLLSGNVTNWDKFSSVQLGGEAAEFTNGAWVSASYDLTVQEDENGKKSLVFGKLA